MLVLDEATSSVDALTEVRISRALTRLAEGRTTIAIAHRLSTAARADRVLVLDDGRLVEDGHHDELVDAGGTYARLYDAWMHATTVHERHPRPLIDDGQSVVEVEIEAERQRAVDRRSSTQVGVSPSPSRSMPPLGATNSVEPAGHHVVDLDDHALVAQPDVRDVDEHG